jgi:hypothetical protein
MQIQIEDQWAIYIYIYVEWELKSREWSPISYPEYMPVRRLSAASIQSELYKNWNVVFLKPNMAEMDLSPYN